MLPRISFTRPNCIDAIPTSPDKHQRELQRVLKTMATKFSGGNVTKFKEGTAAHSFLTQAETAIEAIIARTNRESRIELSLFCNALESALDNTSYDPRSTSHQAKEASRSTINAMRNHLAALESQQEGSNE